MRPRFVLDSTVSRLPRQVVTFVVAMGMAANPPQRVPSAVADAPTTTDTPAAAVVMRIDQCLRVRGEIFAPAGRNTDPVSIPISVDGRFSFLERPRGGRDGLPRDAGCWRRYREARVEIEAAGTKTVTDLPADARGLGVSLAGTTPVPHLTSAHLSRDEFDLLETPFDPLLLDGLVPSGPVAAGSSWNVAADLAAGLLAIDTISAGGIAATLVRIDAETAVIGIGGTVEGAVDGAATQLVVDGTCRVAVPLEAEPDATITLSGPVTHVSVVVRERRQASHVAPGLDVEATIEVSRTPAAGAETDASELPGTESAADDPAAHARRPARRADDPVAMVWTADAQGVYDVVHDPHWREVDSDAGGRTLRFVDHGALLCQCSIASRPATSAAGPTPADLEADIRRSLGGQFRRSEGAASDRRPDGVETVRIVTVGDADGVPFRWIHYVLVDPSGRRAEATFMLEESLVGRFADRDRQFVERIGFRPGPPASARTE